MKVSGSDLTIAKQVGESIRDLNKHGANIYVSEISNDYKYLTIQDLDTKEIYYEGKCGVWLAMYTLLGRNQILKRIT